MAFNDIELHRKLSTLDRFEIAEPRHPTGGAYARFGKRLLDIVLSLMLLPVLLPVLAVIWLAIRSDGGTPVFTQTRVGRNGREFTCYKFRSMVPDAESVLKAMCAQNPEIAREWATFQKLRCDPRITRIGRFLRKTSFDELPQIFNVLKGDMSLVGPRPFLPSQKALYDAEGGQAYYRLRPGITGMWQVLGRGDTKLSTRVRFDEAYGKNLALKGDLALILSTARVVVLRTGS